MNELKIKNFFLFSLLLFLPFIFIASTYGHAIPFFLKGPEFLRFFSLLSALIISLLLLVKMKYQSKELTTIWIVFLLSTGIARMIQGLAHHRPVGYLFAMILTDVIIVVALSNKNQ